MASTSELRTGMVIRYNNDLVEVVEWQHVSPGNWRAFVRLKLKSLKTGKVVEDRVRAGSDIDIVRIDRREMEFLYRDGNDFVFMDKQTFEQMNIPVDKVGEGSRFMKENSEALLVFTEDGALLGVEPPMFVTLQVTETATALRGDTATNVTKSAVLETGATISVPSFVNEGDLVKIDTRSGEYLERANA